MFADEGQYEILPDLVGVALGELQSERGALFVLGHLPDRFDALDEEIDGCSFWHLTWAFKVLVHGPELIDSAKIGERLDILLVPTVTFVLSKDCE